MGRHYREQYDWYECDWCRMRPGWNKRPCLVRTVLAKELLRAKREECEDVRRENAAKRNKTLAKVYRRAMRAAAAAAEAKAEAIPNSSIRTNITGISVVEGLSKLDEKTPVEIDGETDTRTETRTETETTEEVSPLSAASKLTPKPEHHQMDDPKKTQQRQPKSCTGLMGMIDEGVNLASDDGDVARIHASNWRAWPQSQEPIAADATGEDKEVAELVRRGFIGAEALRVDRSDIGGDVHTYTIRFVEPWKKGRNGNNRGRKGVQVTEHRPLHAESQSDRWYMDDEAYA